MDAALFSSPIEILTILTGICAFFFWLEIKTQWKLFNYLPPLIFIYFVPVIFSNSGLLASKGETYSQIKSIVLPMMLVILLLDVNLGSAVKVMGKGIWVMLFGSLGVVVGAPIAFFMVKDHLGPQGWTAFATLAGSWIGGTGNMNAVAEAVATPPAEFGLAILADTLVYVIWLPIMLGSKNFAAWFQKFAKVDEGRLEQMKQAASESSRDKGKMKMHHILYLLFIGLTATMIATKLSQILPAIPSNDPFITAGTWKVLLLSTIGIGLSFTKAHDIPGSHPFAMALVYLYVATMGARADLSGVATQAPWFLFACLIWIFIHGGFCLLGARIFKVDVHTAAIASAANVGGAASAPIVAAYHMEDLVPASILMALIGYAVGNFAVLFIAAPLCKLIAGM